MSPFASPSSPSHGRGPRTSTPRPLQSVFVLPAYHGGRTPRAATSLTSLSLESIKALRSMSSLEFCMDVCMMCASETDGRTSEILKDFRRRLFPIFQRRLHLISTLQTPLNARPPFSVCQPDVRGDPRLEKVGWHARDTYINKDIKTRAHGAAARRRRDETTRRGARGTRGLTSRAVRNEGVAWLPSRRSLRYRAGRALAFTPTQAGRLPCGGIVTERERERERAVSVIGVRS